MPLAAAAPEVQSKHSVETDREAAEVQALAEVAQQANPELAVEVQTELNDRRIVNAVEGVKSEVAALSRAIAKRVPLNPEAAAVPPPQDRITDHRIGYSRSNIPAAMNGQISDLFEHLHAYELELLAKGASED
jgi:peptide chain release factor 1